MVPPFYFFYNMKKRFLIIFLSVVGFSINTMAQKWFVNEHEADALKKKEAYSSYRYEDENGNNFVYWSYSLKSGDYRITTSSDIFDYNQNRFMDITIGLYDIQGNLVDKIKDKAKVEDGANFAKSCKKKIIKYLNEQEGYIRIIAPLYGTTADYDIKVVCHKSCAH